jgi:hypothetical protein
VMRIATTSPGLLTAVSMVIQTSSGVSSVHTRAFDLVAGGRNETALRPTVR